jgi:hypothetical protein
VEEEEENDGCEGHHVVYDPWKPPRRYSMMCEDLALHSQQFLLQQRQRRQHRRAASASTRVEFTTDMI